MISIDKIGIYINLNAAAVTSGAYIGYCEGKGIDTSTTVEYLTKIGPTGFSIFSTPLGIKANQSFREFVYHKLNNGTVKENPIQIEKTKKDLEEKLKEDPRYM
ncbi:hypothetical protein HQ489_05885, partial [Candidatus Woesearchaeota archaeon]|nr:hypothetical protein [Candidatus Woesearchaeota archaeon]